ncbi:efflux RND transporter periplasmic adaptor subunit [Ollibium composti]|uniref:efflux RND transporter periplasmic adaptor subunit n=1 Tax=Ollibium composti TaxID=2675109 RepID=UPI002EDB5D7E
MAAAAAVPQAAFTAEFAVHAITIPEMKAVFGQVESRTVVPARARIGGTIREIRVSEGSEVREGDVIGVVVDDKMALQLAAADAKIAALKSEFANARTELERAEQLVAQGVATQSRLDAARTALEVATNQVAAAEADKAVIAQGAKEGDVLAPATGRVLTVPVTAGSVIMAGEPVARIATGPYYLRLSLPERHAAEIAEGAIVEVGVRGRAQASGAPGATAQGRIVKVYPEIADGRVIADVDVAGIGSYFVNERTLVSIPVGKRSVLAVPQKAVTSLHGIDYVRLAATDGPMDVAVILGETFESQSGTLVEILTGLKDGDRIMLP